jgi:hypothetical protein
MVVQNMSDKPLTLYAGTALAQLYVLKSKIPIFIEEDFQKTSDRGSFGSTGNEFETVKNEPSSFHIKQILMDKHPIDSVHDHLHTQKFSIDNFAINLIGSPVENSQTYFELERFHNKLIAPESTATEIFMENLENEISVNTVNIDSPKFFSSQELSEADLAAILAVDLAQNKKLSVQSLVYFQTMDKNISKIIKHSL